MASPCPQRCPARTRPTVFGAMLGRARASSPARRRGAADRVDRPVEPRGRPPPPRLGRLRAHPPHRRRGDPRVHPDLGVQTRQGRTPLHALLRVRQRRCRATFSTINDHVGPRLGGLESPAFPEWADWGPRVGACLLQHLHPPGRGRHDEGMTDLLDARTAIWLEDVLGPVRLVGSLSFGVTSELPLVEADGAVRPPPLPRPGRTHRPARPGPGQGPVRPAARAVLGPLVPEPIAYDAAGTVAGLPALVMTHLRGTPVIHGLDPVGSSSHSPRSTRRRRPPSLRSTTGSTAASASRPGRRSGAAGAAWRSS